jgi:hypothetical protein
MTKQKCIFCKTRTEVKPTFAFCSQCYEHIPFSTQKEIVDAYQIGQTTGEKEIKTQFRLAVNKAVGDLNYHFHGSRIPDESVKDINGIVLELGDLVEWESNGTTLWGKIIAKYWQTQEITIVYYEDNKPKNTRDNAKYYRLRKKMNQG